MFDKLIHRPTEDKSAKPDQPTMKSLKFFGRRPLSTYQVVKKLHQLGLPALCMLQCEGSVRYCTNIKDHTKRLEGWPKGSRL